MDNSETYIGNIGHKTQNEKKTPKNTTQKTKRMNNADPKKPE